MGPDLEIMLTAPMEWELLPTATVVTRRGATSVS